MLTVRTRRLRIPSLATHVVGLSLAVSGIGIVVSAIVEAIDGGSDVFPLTVCGAVVGAVGIATWRATVIPDQLRSLDAFVAVTMAWVALAVAGAAPYLVTDTIGSIDGALFESISGFTTTGATVLHPIEAASQGVLFWRATTQWLGGMGVIVLVVAVLPTVGVGGMSLLQAEAPGPTGERLTPRVRHTARHLWSVYVGFTVVLAGAYGAAGMSAFDAVAHSFTTVSTGGFSPHSASMRHFDSATIEWIAIVAMFLAGGAFALYYRALRGNVRPLLQSVELRFYAVLVLGSTAFVYLTADTGDGVSTSVRDAFFTITSLTSTTGYVTADYGGWSDSAQALLLLLLPIGAMAGSTAGGVKVTRVITFASFTHREALRQLHPQLTRPVRVGRAVVPDLIAAQVVAFMGLSLVILGGGSLIIAATGTDIVTAFSAGATSMGNVGPGLGDLGPAFDFTNVPRVARLVAMAQMILGRLEIYPVILALSVVTLRRRPRWLRVGAWGAARGRRSASPATRTPPG
jgi:trk system potassium uptake protein TrkH